MIVNLQKKIKVDLTPYRAFAQTILKTIAETGGHDFSIAFVSDHRMKELNRFFRGKDSTTDVLSFPHEADDFLPESRTMATGVSDENDSAESGSRFLGDIVISVEQAAKQAEENRLSLELEIKQLILHGVLHLCGYDHETDNGEMNARELRLRDELGIQG